MTWAKLDDRANEHRKQLSAGPEACWFWACGLMYANRQKERDGFIPDAAIGMLYPVKSPKRLAEKLVAVGLWERVDGGYRIHDFEPGPERNRWSSHAYDAVFDRDGERCRYCNGVDDLTIDHVVPRCQGGRDCADNLVVACRRCNSRKGGRTPQQAGMALQ